MQDYRLDPLDERLIHALQINGRVRWTELAPVLGVDPATLSRRWEALREGGVAWVSGFFPQRYAGALVDISCIPQRVREVEERLIAIPAVHTIDRTSGARDILATVLTDTPRDVWELVTQRIGSLEGVRGTQSHLITSSISEASSWRIRALTAAEAARIPRPHPPRARAPRTLRPEVEGALQHALLEDGRAPVSRIARESGISEQRLADGIALMIAQGRLRLRTDVARTVTGWPIYAWYFMRVPARLVGQARAVLPQIPELRTAFVVASQYNLVTAAWLRELDDVVRFEAALESALPGARIMDRSVVFSMGKHMGRVLDPEGRATRGYVHPDGA
ncbi:Lrp/AsnC family transcriptional regulator [Rothia sp. AR01]|uniref:Lrp/AsnC family transcriptional regulator n=1 Tax=Rothia santali TaxID=2949643 RepID=A0A9X2KJY7_9MICC|nr:Lrp/AsnC family transcriptional regulator [Rothia santali]MCP3424466.1 Lrp/AsnC family transcriptional regulator [Rothia santali]